MLCTFLECQSNFRYNSADVPLESSATESSVLVTVTLWSTYVIMFFFILVACVIITKYEILAILRNISNSIFLIIFSCFMPVKC